MNNEARGGLQLGCTIPLQRYLKIPVLPYGVARELKFCWELHLLRPGGRPSLLAVHASSRFAFLLHDLSQRDWRELPALFPRELDRILAEEGFSRRERERYWALAGACEITKTHGRRPVAFLNRATDDLYALPAGMDPEWREQRVIRLLLNDLPCRAAGHGGRDTARAFLRRDLAHPEEA